MANTTNKPVSEAQVRADFGDEFVDMFKDSIKNCENKITLEQLDEWEPKIRRVAHMPRSIGQKVAHATKAIFKKAGEYLYDDKFLAGVQIGMDIVIYSIAIDTAIKKYKAKKANKA